MMWFYVMILVIIALRFDEALAGSHPDAAH